MTHLDYDGRQWVLLSDYNALAARLAEAEALLRKWQSYADNESDMPLDETDAFLASDKSKEVDV